MTSREKVLSVYSDAEEYSDGTIRRPNFDRSEIKDVYFLGVNWDDAASKLPPGSPAGETASEKYAMGNGICACGHLKAWHSLKSDRYVPAASGCLAECNDGGRKCSCAVFRAVPEPVPTEGAAELRKRAADFIDGLARYPYTARLENPYREIAIAMKFQEMSAAPIAPAAELIQELEDVAQDSVARGCNCYSSTQDNWHAKGCRIPAAQKALARAEEYRKGAKNA